MWVSYFLAFLRCAPPEFARRFSFLVTGCPGRGANLSRPPAGGGMRIILLFHQRARCSALSSHGIARTSFAACHARTVGRCRDVGAHGAQSRQARHVRPPCTSRTRASALAAADVVHAIVERHTKLPKVEPAVGQPQMRRVSACCAVGRRRANRHCVTNSPIPYARRRGALPIRARWAAPAARCRHGARRCADRSTRRGRGARLCDTFAASNAVQPRRMPN